MNDQGAGSICIDEGTERLMARLNTAGEEDFISIKVYRDFVAEILEKAEESGYTEQGNPSLKAYKTRMNINQDKENEHIPA